MRSNQDSIPQALAEMQRGNLGEAQRICSAVLSSRPNDAEALNLRGMIAQHRGDFAAAVRSYQAAVAVRPEAAGFHNNLGVSLTAIGRAREAVDSYRRAAALNPKSAQIQLNLGTSLQSIGQTNPAVEALRTAVALRPDHAESHNSLATSLYMAGDLHGAVAHFRSALTLNPGFASAWSNLANVLRDFGQIEEARAAYRRAIAIQVDHPDARKNLAILQLLTGDYADGFLEYEWRWKCGDAQLRRFDRPRWTGQNPAGKIVFIYEEQGYGDVIQFARYAQALAERGAKVIVGCRPELARVIACFAGVWQVVTAGQPIPAFDLHCPLLSLPLFCGTTAPANVPAQVPYIRLSREITERWSGRFPWSRTRRIGLCWAGNPENRNDRYRSIHPQKFVPLASIPGVELHSLQVGPAAQQLSEACGLAFEDHQAELHDFADSAALIDRLDLVISVDTAVAHLAGALGKAVWVLLPSAPDWRWLLDRSDSPWYPTARLFRQRQDWEQVIADVAAELKTTPKINS